MTSVKTRTQRKAATAMAVLAGGLALAAAPQAPAAAADPVPSCVGTDVIPEVFGFMGVTITNNCADEQRVKATFAVVYSSGPQPQCHVLQPGQAVNQWVKPSGLFINEFLGLVPC
ncbi:hypothetical protein ACWD0J_28970 [Streptomyces sp. NPDC003011]